MSTAFIEFSAEDTGFVIGNLAWDFCTKQTDLSAVSTEGATLEELGFGCYLLKNPDITADSAFRVHVTGSDGKYVTGLFYAPATSVLSGVYLIDVQFYASGTTTPIPDVSFDVWNSDSTIKMNGSSMISDSNGQASFLRDNGTYNIRAIKAGVTFAVTSFAVSGQDMTVTLYGDAIVLSPPTADMQNLTGNVRKLGWGVASGTIIKAVIAGKQAVNGALIQDFKESATVDVNSMFLFVLPKRARVKIIVPNFGEYEITITNDSDKDISTYPEVAG